MHPKNILTASILLLTVSAGALAQDLNIKAQPIITLPPVTRTDALIAAAIGNNASDYFYTYNRAGAYVVFSSAVPYHGYDIRSLFSTRMRDLTNDYYPTVSRLSPLRRLATFVLPGGTQLDSFISSPVQDSFVYRENFRVPGRGLYQLTSGAAPVLIHPDTAKYPLDGVAVRYPTNAVNDSTVTQQERVIFGAAYPHYGSIPFQSLGSARQTAVLKDTLTGKIVTGVGEFTTWNNEVYFVGTNPTGGASDIYKVSVTVHGATPIYKSANVTTNSTDHPMQLTGSNAGLFYTTLDNGAQHTRLVTTSDGNSFANVVNDALLPVQDATDLTSSVDPHFEDIAFSAIDPSTGVRRLGVYSPSQTVVFAEVDNAAAGSTSDPTNIVSTGNFYYFNGTYGGTKYFMRAFPGDNSLQFITESVSGAYVTNPGETVEVQATDSGGQLYFVADALISGTQQTGILFTMDPDAQPPVATPCKTPGGAYVQGAFNLRAVTDHGTVFRCYFTAPVNTGQNAEFAGGKDYGTKPFVVTTP